MNTKCCEKMKTSDFSFHRGPLKTDPVTHIFCHSCKSHYYGNRGNEKLISRDKWETWINTP